MDKVPNFFRLADSVAATEIFHHDDMADNLWLARLNQKRYWTISQARLAVRRIVWEHAAFLKGSGSA